MSELSRVINTGVDISSEATILTYVHSSTITREVMVRVDIGTNSEPIVGNGNYSVRVYLDNTEVIPTSTINISSGVTKAIIISRAIPIETSDTITITALGQPGDTSVTVISSLRDVTPATITEIAGSGSVYIDHDYGGTDELTYVDPDLIGIDNANINVYLTSDWNAGNSANTYIIGRTVTNVYGRWERGLMLDPGDYTLVYYKQGEFGIDIKEITVS